MYIYSPLYDFSGDEFNLHSESCLYSYSNFIFCSVSDFILATAFVSPNCLIETV